MINLLSPDTKRAYGYAEKNIMLVRWLIAFLISLAGVGVITTFGLLYMQHTTSTYVNQVDQTEQLLQKEKLSQTEATVQDITSNLKLVVQVLSREVLFSQLLKQVAATIPANANLTDLTINQTHGAIDVTAITTDYNTATQVQLNLADPTNKIFTKADIVSITCSASSAKDPRYPCTVVLRALFANNNPFLFINNKAT